MPGVARTRQKKENVLRLRRRRGPFKGREGSLVTDFCTSHCLFEPIRFCPYPVWLRQSRDIFCKQVLQLKLASEDHPLGVWRKSLKCRCPNSEEPNARIVPNAHVLRRDHQHHNENQPPKTFTGPQPFATQVLPKGIDSVPKGGREARFSSLSIGPGAQEEEIALT